MNHTDDSVRIKLMIKTNSKVCLFHARKSLLPQFMAGDLNLMLDWADDECDSIIYWLQEKDNLCDIMAHLERQIKRTGRIWLVLFGASKVIVERAQADVIDYTNLMAGKVIDIGDGDTALLFVLRKAAMEDLSQ
ncbi:MAG: hypothetical protein FWE97_01930 [Dehalococcoidia bacterium]|nr:hypothetical protein [Dehalococcoidia bacterium]